MTKEEFTSSFNALFTSDTPDPLAIEKFRSEALTDYDSFTTTQTAFETMKAENEKLTSSNKDLQEVNMKLIMLHPEAIIKSPKADTDPEPTHEAELSDEQKQEAMDKVLAAFGHKKE